MRDNKSQDLKAKEILENPKLLASYIDHTLLKPDAKQIDIERLCGEAIENSFKAVCVNPIWVSVAQSKLASTKVLVASVVGFPLGANLSSIKAKETELAIEDGAREIDMVINIGFLKEKSFEKVAADIREVVGAAENNKVKVIFETGLLTNEEIRSACQISEQCGAAFVKTSTGFLGRGASLEDIQVMFQSTKLEIKASGGVRDLAFACELISAGATRIGTSSGIQLIRSQAATGNY